MLAATPAAGVPTTEVIKRPLKRPLQRRASCSQALGLGVFCGLALHMLEPLAFVGIYAVLASIALAATILLCSVSRCCWTRWHILAENFMPSRADKIIQLRDLWNVYLQVCAGAPC